MGLNIIVKICILIVCTAFAQSADLCLISALTEDKDTTSVAISNTCKPGECQNGGTCTTDESGNTHCLCREGSYGDHCECVPACDTLKYRYCKGYNGTCVLGDKPYEAICECNNEKKFDENLDICRETCEDGDCKNGAICTADASGNKFCDCRKGSTGDFCEIVAACDALKFRYCKGENGTCVLGDKSYEAICECNYEKKFDEHLDICRETCEDGDCKNGAICIADASGNKFCDCREGSTGDSCETVAACYTLKFRYCKGDNGTCVLGDKPDEAICECNYGKKFDGNLDICRGTCKDGDCKNSANCTADSSGNKFCHCREGSSGDLCQIVTACDDPKFRYCKGDNGTCILGDKSYAAVCECNGDKEFDESLQKCRATCKDGDCKNGAICMVDVSGNNFCQCREGSSGDFCENVDACDDLKFRYCKGVNGTCVLGDTSYEAVCECNDGRKFDEKLDICRDTCGDGDCKNGGMCIINESGYNFCLCREGSTGDFCDIVAACDDPKFQYCKGDNGTCVLGEKSYIAVCHCNDGKEFDENLDVCRETCENDKCKNDAICTADVNRNKFCHCREGSCGDFCEIVAACENPKYQYCKGDNGTCTLGDKPLTAICECNDGKEFDDHRSECRENKCKTTCGETEVICIGDPFGDADVNCTCADNSKEFVSKDKLCKVNMCKEVCGGADGVKCEGDPYGNDVFCGCKDKTEIFISEQKNCLSLCEPNPCLNGAECITVENRGFSCKCKDSYIGILCNETNHAFIGPCNQDHTYIIILGSVAGILLVVLLIIIIVNCHRRNNPVSYHRVE